MKPVREIPGSVTIIDAAGNKTTKSAGWGLMPPAPDKCQICAVAHEPGLPHNRDSLYYQVAFNGMVGRAPTWADALAHCSPEMQKAWREELTRRGAWSEPPAGEAPVLHHGAE